MTLAESPAFGARKRSGVIKMTTGQHKPTEPRAARGSLLRRGARAIREVNRAQIDGWERYFQAGPASVSHEGPLTWVLTLDGYRLAGSYLPVPAERA
jgi:hypothetical protein